MTMETLKMVHLQVPLKIVGFIKNFYISTFE